MSPEAILFPSIAMFLLSAAMLVRLGAMRFRATTTREVSISYYALYRGENTEPDALRLMSRHAHNHFETPPLFHIVILMTYVTGQVSALAVGLAWAFVALRLAHTLIHLSSNNVMYRFMAFIGAATVLAALWLRMLVVLL